MDVFRKEPDGPWKIIRYIAYEAPERPPRRRRKFPVNEFSKERVLLSKNRRCPMKARVCLVASALLFAGQASAET